MFSTLRRAFSVSGQSVTEDLDRDGVSLVRHAFSREEVAKIMAAACAVYEERDAQHAAGTLPKHLENFHVRKRTIKLQDLMIDDTPALEAVALPVFRAQARKLLGREPELFANSFVRTIYAAQDAWRLPFHQDQGIFDQPLLNVWIALTDCGRDAPGLEVVKTPSTDILETFAGGDPNFAAAQKQISESMIVERFGAGALWHPEMKAGDALVFKGTTVHRSYFTPQMNKPRTSIELRLI